MFETLLKYWPAVAAGAVALAAAFPRLKPLVAFLQSFNPGLKPTASTDHAGDIDGVTEHVKELIKKAQTQEQIDAILLFYGMRVRKAPAADPPEGSK